MSDRLGILSVSTADIGGGAERVARDLHEEYLARGHESWMAVGCKHGDDPRVFPIDNETARSRWARSMRDRAHRLDARARRGDRLAWLASRAAVYAAGPRRAGQLRRGIEEFDYPATGGILDLPPRCPDVMHLHNLHGYYFDLRQLPALTARVPGVLTMHDAWALTGHCAHPFDCDRWVDGCGACPDLDIYVPVSRDATAENWRIKRAALEASRLFICTPSRWLMDMVDRSGLLERAVGSAVIPNGVRTDVFQPGDKAAARRALDLPADATLVLTASRAPQSNPFKDYATLEAAFESLTRPAGSELVLVALGGPDAVRVRMGDIIVEPFCASATEVARYYQAADVYVHASRAENLPLAVIEALACGTPAVASRVGGIPEIIEDGDNGLLVDSGDSVALARAIDRLIADRDLAGRLGARGRAVAEARYTLARQADAYLSVFAELL